MLRFSTPHFASLLAVMTILGALPFASANEPATGSVVAPEAELKKLETGFKFTEGPAWHPQGFLVFSDIPNNRIHKWTAEEGISEFVSDSGGTNGIICTQDGSIFTCQMGIGKVAVRDGNGKLLSTLAASYDEKSLNSPNDLAIDQHGGMYFTDPKYSKGDPTQPMMGVYYLSANGELKRLIEDLKRPNGVTISPDHKFLYVAEPDKRQVYRYDIAGPGQLTAGKLIYEGDAELDGGGPDGMAHDKSGRLYCTYKSIVVLDENGKRLERIAVPEKPANCTIGGKSNKTLFITARTSLYSIELSEEGQSLEQKGPAQQGEQSQSRVNSPVLQVLPASYVALAETKEFKAGTMTLNVPTAWKEQQPSNRLRLAQFEVKGDAETAAEFVVFPPFGGTIDANLERWVNSFHKEELKSEIKKGESKLGVYHLVDLTGTYKKPDGPPFLRKTIDVADYRMMAVIVSVPEEGNYFVRLVGPKAIVEANAKAFRSSFGADAAKEKDYELK